MKIFSSLVSNSVVLVMLVLQLLSCNLLTLLEGEPLKVGETLWFKV